MRYEVDDRWHYELESDEEFLSEFSKNKVTVPDTIFDNGLDVPGGLMDQNIFGPLNNYTCRCGNYHGLIFKDEVCPKCGVTVTSKSKRKTAWGYFDLNIALPIPIYSDIILTHLFKLNKEFRGFLFNGNQFYLIKNEKGNLVSYDGTHYSLKIKENDFNEIIEDSIFLGYGIEMLEKYSEIIDLSKNPSSFFTTRMNLLNELVKNPLTKIFRVIPVNYREIHKVGNLITVDQLNITYKFIMSHAIELKFLQDSNPEGYAHNAKYWYIVKLLYELIQDFIVRGGLEFKGHSISTYKSILSGKGGRVRSTLLGKRSNFSGRSVNIANNIEDIDISHDEYQVPFYMAKNIYRPQLIADLNKMHGISYSHAMEMIDNDDRLVIDLLKEEYDGRYYWYTVRQPALYSNSIPALKCRINFNRSEKGLKISPLINKMFNLDHDGDTMANFFPITEEGQDEARTKAVPSCNPYYDKNGKPIYGFELEYIFGLYFATNPKFGKKIDQTGGAYLCDYSESNGKKITIGSQKINEIFANHKVPNTYYELGVILDSSKLTDILIRLLNELSRTDALSIIMDLMRLSTQAFTESGLSIKFNDFIEFDRSKLNTLTKFIEYNEEEKRLISQFKESGRDNSLLSMMICGAKGGATQIKQLMISKGILVDVDGNYLDPIYHSLHDGLSIDEFITTIHAGRRGLVSKSLSTAQTGYYYYRVAKSMRDTIITEEDCGTSNGLKVKLDQVIGRTLNEDLNDEFKKGHLVSRSDFLKIKKLFDLSREVSIRSPLFCDCKKGVCKKCYGIRISRDAPPQIGDRVGLLTASTLSEVLSQAMLKNFHTAGATNAETKMVYSNSSIPELRIEHELIFDKIYLDDKLYVLPSNKVSYHKIKDINPGDHVFSFSVISDDISIQFKRLDSISELRSKDDAIIIPEDGTLKFDKIVSELVESKNSLIPGIKRYISAHLITEDKLKILKIPFERIMLIPFNSYVKKGDIITEGNIDFRYYSGLVSYDKLVSRMTYELDHTYKLIGSKIRLIHLEMYAKNLITKNSDGTITLNPMTTKGLSRSFIQWVSIGYIKKAFYDILDDINLIGDTNAEKVALGIYD